MNIKVEETSLKAVTIGPDATAGSILKLAKKKGENVPKNVAVIEAPKTPELTIVPNAKGLSSKSWIPKTESK